MREVGDFIARDKPKAAFQFLHGLRETIRRLGDSPQIGRRRDDVGEGLRSFPHAPCLIWYRISPDGCVEVLRVLHGARAIHPRMFE